MHAAEGAGVSRRTALAGLIAALSAGCGKLSFMAANIPAAFGSYRRHADVAYGREFTRLFAELTRAERTWPKDGGTRSLLERARTLRRELGEYAVEKENQGAPGVLIEKVEIGREDCYLILDTGAALVTLSPELVSALTLGDSLGKEEESAVAGGMTARGRRLTLPRVRLGEAEASDVPAMQLASSMLGVDGLLGRSFLRQFVLTIDDHADPKVSLRRR